MSDRLLGSDEPDHPPPAAGLGRDRRRRHRPGRGRLPDRPRQRRGDAPTAPARVPFYGEHQAGIATPAQDRLHFAAFDLRDREPRRAARTDARVVAGGGRNDRRRDDRRRQRRCSWRRRTTPARRSACRPPTSPSPSASARACSSAAASASPRKRPAALQPIPPLPGDELNRLESGGDLCVQACADDPQVAFHAIRNLARIGRGTVAMRWSQLGFGRTSTTSRSQDTPRNLMGFKDGTANIKRRGHRRDATLRLGRRRRRPGLDARRQLPGHPPDPDADRGLGPLLARRPGADDRPRTRTAARRSAAATSSTRSTSTPNRDGKPVIPADAHVRLASPQTNGGVRILRRGYSFTDGIDEASASSKPGCSSSASSATRARSSSRSSASSAPTTRSTSTSSTSAAPSSRCRPAPARRLRRAAGLNRCRFQPPFVEQSTARFRRRRDAAIADARWRW